MIAFKFLRAGAVGPFTGFRWPAPGEWVAAARAPRPCRDGVHACRTADLPYWIWGDELWEVELDAPVVESPSKLVAPRGRLVSRIKAWNRVTARDYARACAWRCSDLAAAALADEELATATHMDQVTAAARRIADGAASAHDATTARYVLDAADRVGPTPAQAAAAGWALVHLAAHLGGEDEVAAERARQARWLARRLDLPLEPG